MEQYIPKSVLVAWMNRFIDDETESNKLFEHRKNACPEAHRKCRPESADGCVYALLQGTWQ